MYLHYFLEDVLLGYLKWIISMTSNNPQAFVLDFYRHVMLQTGILSSGISLSCHVCNVTVYPLEHAY